MPVEASPFAGLPNQLAALSERITGSADDVLAWLKQGQTLLPRLLQAEQRARDEAAVLEEQAEALLDRAEAKAGEAKGIQRWLQVLRQSLGEPHTADTDANANDQGDVE